MNPNNIQQDSISTLLRLLDKAEQILSIINLSDNAISKYNQLKQLTYNKLNLPFQPLIKKFTIPSNQSIPDLLTQQLYFQNVKQSMIIDLLLDFIQNSPNIDLNCYLQNLTKIFNFNINEISNKSNSEIECETKCQEQKMSDLYKKCDELFHQKTTYFNSVFNDYQNKINNIKNSLECENLNLKNEFCKYQCIEQDFCKLQKENDFNLCLLNKLSNLINCYFPKFFNDNYNSNCFPVPNGDESDIQKLEYLLNTLDKIDLDNKYFQKTLPALQNEKMMLTEKQNLPFVQNVIENNDLMRDICFNINDVSKESEVFHKNFEELMNYIQNNIEGKVM